VQLTKLRIRIVGAAALAVMVVAGVIAIRLNVYTNLEYGAGTVLWDATKHIFSLAPTTRLPRELGTISLG
jgi:hypothetical protein